MKKLFYTIYAVIFRICRLFPVKRGRVALVSPHNADFNDSLGAVKAELERRGDYDIKLITRRDIELSKNPAKLIKGAFRFFFVSSYRLATAQYVFLNDNFMPLAYINFSPETKVVQLWHAEGVFKRFGLCSALPPEIEELEKRCCKRYTHAVCSSKMSCRIMPRRSACPRRAYCRSGARARTDSSCPLTPKSSERSLTKNIRSAGAKARTLCSDIPRRPEARRRDNEKLRREEICGAFF